MEDQQTIDRNNLFQDVPMEIYTIEKREKMTKLKDWIEKQQRNYCALAMEFGTIAILYA